jgi:hypothetical protein
MADEGSGDGAKQQPAQAPKKVRLIPLDPKTIKKSREPKPSPRKPARPS